MWFNCLNNNQIIQIFILHIKVYEHNFIAADYSSKPHFNTPNVDVCDNLYCF